jgi:hypothetical protein
MIYSPSAIEAPVNESGEFSLDSVIEGKWLLLVLRKDQLLLSKLYSFDGHPASIEVDLRH